MHSCCCKRDCPSFQVSNMVDFNSCTPFKTPSRKPEILRQLVMESRQIQDGDLTKGRQAEDGDFTTNNAGPLRPKSALTNPNVAIKPEEKIERRLFTKVLTTPARVNQPQSATAARVNQAHSTTDFADSTNIDAAHVDATISLSGVKRMRSPPQENPMNGTFVLTKSQRAPLGIVNIEALVNAKLKDTACAAIVPEASLKSSKVGNSSIPVLTPTKKCPDQRPMSQSKPVSRARSQTEGNHTFAVPDLNATYVKGKTKTPGYAKPTISQKKRSMMNLGAPSRARSMTDVRVKENEMPRPGSSFESRNRYVKPAVLRRSTSCKNISKSSGFGFGASDNRFR